MEIICSSYLPVCGQSMVHFSAVNTEVSYLPQSLHCEKKRASWQQRSRFGEWSMTASNGWRNVMWRAAALNCPYCMKGAHWHQVVRWQLSGDKSTAAILSPRTLFGVGSNSSSIAQVSLLWWLQKQLKYTDVLTWSNWVVFIQIMMHDDCITQPLSVLFDSSELSVRRADQDQMFQWLREYFHINNGSSDKPTENCMTQSSPYHCLFTASYHLSAGCFGFPVWTVLAHYVHCQATSTLIHTTVAAFTPDVHTSSSPQMETFRHAAATVTIVSSENLHANFKAH